MNQSRPNYPSNQSEEEYLISFEEISEEPQLRPMVGELHDLMTIWVHANELPNWGL